MHSLNPCINLIKPSAWQSALVKKCNNMYSSHVVRRVLRHVQDPDLQLEDSDSADPDLLAGGLQGEHFELVDMLRSLGLWKRTVRVNQI